MKSDKTYLEWPFFEARHAQLERELDAWAGQHIAQDHEHDVDAACRQLVRQLSLLLSGDVVRHQPLDGLLGPLAALPLDRLYPPL